MNAENNMSALIIFYLDQGLRIPAGAWWIHRLARSMPGIATSGLGQVAPLKSDAVVDCLKPSRAAGWGW